jgi:tRNA nucleotidyltransferase (CCA-adding enzyme)
MRIINDLKLHKSIYHIPPQTMSIASSSPKSWDLSLRAATILHDLLSLTSPAVDSIPLHPTLRSYVLQPGCKARLFLAASLYSYRGITYLDEKGKEQTLVKCAIQDGLKLGRQNHYLDGIPALYSAADLLEGAPLEQTRLKLSSERVAIGIPYNHATGNPIDDEFPLSRPFDTTGSCPQYKHGFPLG